MTLFAIYIALRLAVTIGLVVLSAGMFAAGFTSGRAHERRSRP